MADHAMANSAITLTPTLFFHGDGPAAAAFYVSLFPGSLITSSTPATITLSLLHDTVHLLLINVPPSPSMPWRPNESFSLSVVCDTQAEVDYYWGRLTTGGGEESRCCWCRDAWGVSWQIVPRLLVRCLEAGGERADRAREVMFGWGRPDVAALERAVEGVV